MRFLQLNVQKQRNVQHSLMNDANLKDFTALIVSEPYVFEMGGKAATVSMGHQVWTAIVPSARRGGKWAVRSMLWVRRDIECEHVTMPSADRTVALLRLPDRSVLVASWYVNGGNVAPLNGTMKPLNEAIRIAGRRGGPRLDVVVAGDFNRNDQLWAGDEVLPHRQGEADPIIDFTGEWGLESLLPRGTKTWQDSRYTSMIALMLASRNSQRALRSEKFTARSTSLTTVQSKQRSTSMSQSTSSSHDCCSRMRPGRRYENVPLMRFRFALRAVAFRCRPTV